MKLKMSEKSLFAILLRSQWWISIGVAVLIALIASAALPRQYIAFGIFSAIPFVIIGIMAAIRQARTPSEARVTDALQAAGAMPWKDLSGVIEEGFRRDGYEVSRINNPAADFIITKAGRTALVSAKRWKAASLGAEPLRALAGAMDSLDAGRGIYLVNGEITQSARRLAANSNIRFIQGIELARLCGLGRK